LIAPLRLLAAAVLLATACGALSGCAASAGDSRTLQWIQEDEAQKRRLEEAGFPQYIGE
jgi:ABC-type glycerol-3-phosphate transport system substrate-binding protein